MKIIQLSLNDFRGIRALTLDLSESQVAILIGANGAGKSSILDAAAIALTRITAQLGATGAGKRHIQTTDINNKQTSASVKIDLAHRGEQYNWLLTRRGRNTKKQEVEHLISRLDDVKKLASALQSELDNEVEASVPVLAYYPVNRAVLDIPLKIRVAHDFSPLGAYENALTSATNFRVFFEWFRNREDIENEKRIDAPNFRDSSLEAVRTAIQTFMAGCTQLRVRRNPLRMTINKAGEEVLINQLSDGEKCLLALIGDLARRFAIANPNSAKPLSGEGIVLIDEIELHLHPAWQRSVVHQLKTTFPNCQFLISTHSPQVLGDGKDSGIFAITAQSDDANDKENRIPPLGNLYGADSNRILDEFMGAGTRTIEVSNLLSTLFLQIEKKDWPLVRRLSDELSQLIDHDDPDLLKARLLMSLKGS